MNDTGNCRRECVHRILWHSRNTDIRAAVAIGTGQGGRVGPDAGAGGMTSIGTGTIAGIVTGLIAAGRLNTAVQVSAGGPGSDRVTIDAAAGNVCDVGGHVLAVAGAVVAGAVRIVVASGAVGQRSTPGIGTDAAVIRYPRNQFAVVVTDVGATGPATVSFAGAVDNRTAVTFKGTVDVTGGRNRGGGGPRHMAIGAVDHSTETTTEMLGVGGVGSAIGVTDDTGAGLATVPTVVGNSRGGFIIMAVGGSAGAVGGRVGDVIRPLVPEIEHAGQLRRIGDAVAGIGADWGEMAVGAELSLLGIGRGGDPPTDPDTGVIGEELSDILAHDRRSKLGDMD